MTSSLDAMLQRVCPTIMAPRFEPFAPLATDGHRFVNSDAGLYLEVRRPWLSLLLPIADSAIPLPYGPVSPRVEFDFGLGLDLAQHVARFIVEARSHQPDEHAAWLSYDRDAKALCYELVEAIERNGGHIRYARPTRLPGSRTLAVDLHSHGRHTAFFSAEDDRDGLDDVKLEIVVGKLDVATPSFACRLSALGLRLNYTEWLTALLDQAGLTQGTGDVS